jgi:hypothetical protein
MRILWICIGLTVLALASIGIYKCISAIRTAGLAEQHLNNIIAVLRAIREYRDKQHVMPEDWNDFEKAGFDLTRPINWPNVESTVIIKWPIDEAKIRSKTASVGDYVMSISPHYHYDQYIEDLDSEIRK